MMSPKPIRRAPRAALAALCVAGLCTFALGFLTGPESLNAQQRPAPGPPTTAPPPQGGRGAAPAPAVPRIRALVISGGCCHEHPAQNARLVDVIRRTLPVNWTVVYEGGTERTGYQPFYANPDWAKGYDIVVHNECFGFNDDESLIRRIVAPHRAGIPAMVVHCSMHSYRMAPNADVWREFLGVTSTRHTSAHRIAVKIAPGGDPLLQGWKADWTTPTDELYVIEKFWPSARALATAVSPEAGNAEYPVVWLNDYYGTRVFATTLGHGESWNDPVFQDLLVRGFQWALKREPAAAGRGAGAPATP